MYKNFINNSQIEMIELLPDDVVIDVSKVWCSHIISFLRNSEYDDNLLNMLNFIISNQSQNDFFPNYRFIKMYVGDIKKIINLCDNGVFCCILPYNYSELSNKFLEDNLGALKIKIDLFIANNKINELFALIEQLDNDYIKRLSFLYAKFIYNNETSRIVEEIRDSRKRTISEFNNRLYC